MRFIFAAGTRHRTLAKFAAWIVVLALVVLMWREQDVIDYCTGAPRGPDLLLYAAGSGTEEQIDRALSQGADVNGPGVAGITPLIVASCSGHTYLVRALVARGADPNLSLRAGLCPLYSAVIANDGEIVDVLIASGADPNRMYDGETMLDVAVRLKRDDAAAALQQHHAQRSCDDL
jgi:ankyrin repeat protein